MKKDIQMKSKKMNWTVRNAFAKSSITAVCWILALLGSLSLLSQQKPSETSSQNQKTFSSAKEAADAFIQAAGSFDVSALDQILGPHGEDLIASEDSVRDKANAARFAAEAQEK